MCRLSININKLATLRNARGGNNPDLISWARLIEEYGAQGITVHPRPDERHIRYADVRELKDVVTTEFNIEGYPSEPFIELIQEVRPDQVTLVPDAPDVLTSNAGWDVLKKKQELIDIIGRLKTSGARVSLFMDPDLRQIEALEGMENDRIELYTESYAKSFASDADKAIEPYCLSSARAADLGFAINAGHDLDMDNLAFFKKNIPQLAEVSIGHALVCDALKYGMENTVRMYLKRLR